MFACTSISRKKLYVTILFMNYTRYAYFYHHHHHHVSVMELGHLLTRSGLTYPEVASKVCHDSFYQSGSGVSLPWLIYYGASIYMLYPFSLVFQ